MGIELRSKVFVLNIAMRLQDETEQSGHLNILYVICLN